MNYILLPFRFMRFNAEEVFLSNEVGEYTFLSNEDFTALVQERLEANRPCFDELEYKQFICTGNLDDVLPC